MGLWIPLSAAVVPALLILWYFTTRDVFREPARVIWATFFLGVLSIVPVLVVALVVNQLIAPLGGFVERGIAQAFLVAAGPEEFFKLQVLIWYCLRHREFDEPMDGIVYGVTASLGFAAFENIFYVSADLDQWLFTAVMRSLTAVPLHGALGAIMGQYVAQARFAPQRRRALLWRAWWVPALLHGLYNAPLLVQQEAGAMRVAISGGKELALGLGAIAVLAVAVVWALRLTARLRARQVETVKGLSETARRLAERFDE